MERKIGEIFEYNGEWYQCLIGNCCRECDFSSNNITCDRIDGITFSKHPYPSKEEAIKNVGTMSNRIDTVKISWEE